jgi:hypothetical protein
VITLRSHDRRSQSGLQRILIIQVQEIEGKEHEAERRIVDGRTECIKVGDAVLIIDDDLAVYQCRIAGEFAGSIDHPAIGSGPVPAMLVEGPDLAAIVYPTFSQGFRQERRFPV